MSKIDRAFKDPVWCILSVLLFAPSAQAQSRYAEIALRNGRAHVYHEAIVLPGAREATASVLFRIPNSLLIFVQQGSGFAADVEVRVEVQEKGRTRAERVWRGTYRAATFEETQSKTSDLQGSVRFDLPAGEYSYRLVIGEGAAGDRLSGQPQPFRVADPEKEQVWRGFFVDRVDTTGASLKFVPTGLAGDVPLGKNVQTVIPVAGSLGIADIGYRLHRVDSENEEALRRVAPFDRYDIRPADVLVGSGTPGGFLSPGALSEDDCLCWDFSASAEFHLALLDLQTDGLESGTYVLDFHVEGDGRSEQSQIVFRTHWRGMPLSLYDVEVAIRNLEFIESRDAVRALLRGTRRDRIEKFKSYWRERDPTPGTIENELMEEYYRRVDYAALEFRSGGAPYPDGLRSDAARVYVVHGPPDKISHSFPSSGGVQQEWTYNDGRRFVFRSASSLDPLVLEERRAR